MKNIKNISAGTVIRTLCLVLALANQLLTVLGKSPLPISSEELTQVVSYLLTAGAALAAWWKNNSFTSAAVMADGILHELRCTGVDCTCVTVSSGK